MFQLFKYTYTCIGVFHNKASLSMTIYLSVLLWFVYNGFKYHLICYCSWMIITLYYFGVVRTFDL